MLKAGSACFAYETLEVDGKLPLLVPMSEVAGRMAIQVGASSPREGPRRPRRPAGRRPRRRAGQRPHPRRRHGRHQRGEDGGRPGRPRHDHRHQPRPPALPRRRDAQERHDDLQQRRSTSTSACATPTSSSAPCSSRAPARPILVPRSLPEGHEGGLGHRRRRRRPGRLLRDDQADDARRPDLRRGRRRPLRRGEHAGRGRRARARTRSPTPRSPSPAASPSSARVGAVKQDAQLRSAVNAWKGKVTHTGVADAFGLPCVDVTTLA